VIARQSGIPWATDAPCARQALHASKKSGDFVADSLPCIVDSALLALLQEYRLLRDPELQGAI
jgi:hypothetical protein